MLLNILLAALSTQAQQQPKYHMRIYQDSAGKIFVNLKQPLYFKVSPSPNVNSQKYLLTNSSTPGIVNPLYLSHEGINEVYTPWAIDTATKQHIYPLRNVVFVVYADGTPPFSKLEYNKNYIQRSSRKFFAPGLKISLFATDRLSGVQLLAYSINGQSFKTYDSSLEFTKQGKYKLSYYAVDNVGNVEKPKTFEFYIDNKPPETELEIVGPHLRDAVSARTKLILRSQDSGVGVKSIYYSLDDLDTVVYRNVLNFSNMEEGRHSLVYYSVDLLGNKETVHKYNFFLDKTPPLILEDIIGNSYFVGNVQYLSGNSKLKLTAIDNYSGVKALYYSFDGKNWQLYKEPIPFPETNKIVKLVFYAVDSLGNKSSIDESLAMKGGVFKTYMDLTPPQISYKFVNYYQSGDTVFLGPRSKIILSAEDSQSGVRQINYQLDTSEIKDYNKPIKVLEQGSHKLTVTAFDNVNNIEMKDVYFKVDTAAPRTKIFFSLPARGKENGLKVYPRRLKVFIVAQDNLTGVKNINIFVNGKKVAGNLTMLSQLPKGKVKLKVVSSDYLGNERTQIYRFIIQ